MEGGSIDIFITQILYLKGDRLTPSYALKMQNAVSFHHASNVQPVDAQELL